MKGIDLEPTAHPAPRRNYAMRLSASELTFHATALVWLCAAAALWLTGWTIARFAPKPVPNPEAAAAFLPWLQGFLAPEPDERRLYVVLTLLSPVLLLMAWAAVRRFFPRPHAVSQSPDPRWQGSSAWTTASAALVFVLGGGTVHLWLTANFFTEVLKPVAGLGLLTFAGVLAGWWTLTRRVHRQPRRIWRNLFWVVALLLSLAGGLAYRVFDYRTAGMVNTVNINSTFYSIAQAANGQHALVDFVPQYGCYGAMLKPWFALVGLTMSNITVTLAALECIALASIAFALSRLLRSGWLLLLGMAALIWLGDTWREVLFQAYDPYFQYFPIRVIFPALSVLAAWGYLRQPMGRRAAVAGLLGGLAVWWNVDTGAVTLVSLLGLFFVKALSERGLRSAAGRWRAAGHFGVALGAALLALVGFYLFLCLDARQKVDLSAALRYQNIFYISGFYMMRMPATLHLWQVVVGVYLLGLAGALGEVIARRPLSVGNGMLLYLSVLGIGLFSYFQGRSHDHVLACCMWPAVIVALLLCDRQLAAARYGLLPRAVTAGALPALLLLTLCALSLWQSSGFIVQINRGRWQLAREHPEVTNVPAEVAYIKRTVRRGESCAIISPQQAIYYTATRLRSAWTGQSLFECMLKIDAAHCLTQLRERRAQHLFTEHARVPELDMYPLGPEFNPTLYDAYRLTGHSPDGRMLHWEARSDADFQAEAPGRLAREFAARSRLKASPPAEHHALREPLVNLLLASNGECVQVPYDWGSVSFGSDWAIEAVFTPAAEQPEYACLISNHPGRSHDGLTIQRPAGGPPGSLVCFFGDGNDYTVSAPLQLKPNREHYLAVSCEANRVSLFVDGAPQQQLTLPGPVPASPTALTIGDWVAGQRAFQGDIAEVKIHARPLSAEMIARNAANLHSSNGTPPDPTPPAPNP